MKHSCVAVLLGCLSLCILFSLSMGAGEICDVNGMSIPVNQQKEDANNCILYKCIMQNNRLVLDKYTCVTLKLKRGCKSVPGNPKATFPNCCPTSACRGGQWDNN
uniref:Putative La1-like peptide n=1 Tax=Megacormus gertschi TaxID=1843536 RepID=A0A224X3P2_9SCOR